VGSSTGNRLTRWVGRTLLLSIGIGTGWLGASRIEASGSTAAPTGLATVPVAPRALGATVLATGVIRPKVGAQVAVGSRASGVLRKLHVTVGDRVRAGQLLAELDRTEFETQVQRSEAALANAAAQRAFAEDRLGRMRQLERRAGATGFELAEAALAVDASRAREREAFAAVNAARVQLGYASIHAPIGGVVGTISTQEGETVAASFAAPTFLTIVDLSRLEVWAYVDETDIGRIGVGQRANFTVDTWPDQPFGGRVTAVRPTAEVRDNVVNYVTLIEIDARPGYTLRPEMTATIDIIVEGREATLAVPNGALRRDAQGSYVTVPGRAGVERRAVEVGFRGSDYSEVLSGLRAGEAVAIGPERCEPVTSNPRGGT